MTAQDPALVPTHIRPPSRWPGLGLREAWRYRSLCMVLSRRLLKVRYRQTAIGIGWAVGQPMMMMVVFTIFFGMLARIDTDGVPYPVFYFSALAVFGVMSKILSEGSQAIITNSALVDRVYFPRIYLPAAVAFSSLVDLAANGVALAVLLVLYGIVPTWGVVLLPWLLLVGLGTALGLSLWLGALNVAYRDVQVILPVLTQVWFFATPIIYPADLVPPEWQSLYYLNPAALTITGVRWAVTGTGAPPPEAWVLGTVVGAVILVTGYIFFRQRQATFADVV